MNTRNHRKHIKKTSTPDYPTPEVQKSHLLFFDETVQLFESKCQSLTHFCCQKCQMAGLNIKQSCRNRFLCATCQATSVNQETMNKELPIWKDKQGIVQ